MKDHYTAYVRQVGHELDVPRRRKKKLLCGLQSELRERFAEAPSEEMLLAEVGQPKEVACALLESVDPEERKRYRTAKLLRSRCAAAALTVLLALSVGAFFYFGITRVNRAKVIIVQDPAPTYYSTDEGD